jgi:hypothetical protein
MASGDVSQVLQPTKNCANFLEQLNSGNNNSCKKKKTIDQVERLQASSPDNRLVHGTVCLSSREEDDC